MKFNAARSENALHDLDESELPLVSVAQLRQTHETGVTIEVVL